MTSVRPRRWALLLCLYIAVDFMDPSIPGVFFFDSEVLFVDAVIQLKSNASRDRAASDPMPLMGSTGYDDENATASVRAFTRASRPRQTRRKNPKPDDSASFESSSPPDALPTPPLS